jgi:hypothetical protein
MKEKTIKASISKPNMGDLTTSFNITSNFICYD